MSHAPAACDTEGGTLRAPSSGPRVRHLAREAFGLMAFSAVASTVLAGCLLLLTALGHRG